MLKKSLVLCLVILLVFSLGGVVLAAGTDDSDSDASATIDWNGGPGEQGQLYLPDAAENGEASNPINVAGD